jgi:multiple sugar transport system ATP-binding protein
MGDRVAVIKKGRLQQVDAPQALYDSPVNLFVGGFIGSPAMNMVAATLVREGDELWVGFGDIRLRVDDEVAAKRPGLGAFVDRPIVVGIRPENLEDAELEKGAPADRSFRTTVDLREALGSEVLVHFAVAAPPVLTEDTKELARDAGTPQAFDGGTPRETTAFIARLDPRTSAQERSAIDLVVDTARFHFFDPDTGLGIYDAEPAGRAPAATHGGGST